MLSIKIFLKHQKYFASAFLFFCFSLIFSTWVTYIPAVAERIGITEGKIGGAIFFASLGSFVMIPLANRLVKVYGVGRLTYVSLLLYSLSLLGPLLAVNYVWLCIALFFFGLSSSCYAIGLNSLTATIEKQDKVYIMSGSHGFWSIGGTVGASLGSFMAALLENPLLHAVLIIGIVAGTQTYLRRHYYSRVDTDPLKEKHQYKYMRPMVVIALLGLIFMVAEGAIADWSALYLKKIVNLPLPYIGMGYAAFSFAMVIGRFSGDSLSQRFGSWQLLSFASLVSILGFSSILFAESWTSLAGFFIVGLGFSVIVPEVYRLASQVEGIKTSDGVSIIAATTNIGFLVGPVLLGFLAELKDLRYSFMVLTVMVTVAFGIAGWRYVKRLRG